MLVRTVRHAFKRLLTERKIVIISQNRVRSIPIGAKTQLFFFLCLVGFCAWSSYSTGIFLAYKTLVESKEEQVLQAQQKTDALNAQFALMHHDVQRIVEKGAPSKDAKDKESYNEFVAGLYTAAPQGEENNQLLKRIGFLESRVAELEGYRQRFLDKVGTKTSLQLDKLKHIIDMTGLDVEELSQQTPDKPVKAFKISPEDKVIPEENEDNAHQGGPFIGISSPESHYYEKTVMDGVSELVNLNGIYASMPLGLPIHDAHVSSGFGARRDPLTRRAAVHYGLDLSAPQGSQVFATGPGTVITAGRTGAYGNLIEIDHGYGITTRYGHLKEIRVQVGDIIKRGQTIGVQGNTGRSTGFHLHYEVRMNDKPLDPQKFLTAGSYAEEKRLSEAR
jgi:murein DD-endopeptidase MepM/ murein hydrolase activator NlpD